MTMLFKNKGGKVLKILDIAGTIKATCGKLDTSTYRHFETLKRLTDMRDDDDIKGVLLRINSPGGTAGASMELAMTIKELTKKKPVVAHISDMACSGALMASVACTKTVASPMSLIGSIGVIMTIPNLTGASDKTGIKMNVIKSAPMKDIGSPFRDMTEEEREYLKRAVEDSHKVFMDYVEENRNTGRIEEISDGKFFNAKDALDFKLIDGLGSLNDSMRLLETLVNVDSKSAKWEYPEEKDGIVAKLLGLLAGAFGNSVKTELESLLRIYY